MRYELNKKERLSMLRHSISLRINDMNKDKTGTKAMTICRKVLGIITEPKIRVESPCVLLK